MTTIIRCDRCGTQLDAAKVTGLLVERPTLPDIEQDLCEDCANVVVEFLEAEA